MKRLQDKTVLITGATGGLGSHLTLALCHEGAQLILSGRSDERLKNLADALGGRPGQKCLTVAADLRKIEAPLQILKETRNVFERVDVLINNAGIQGPIGPCWENDGEAWQETLSINLLAPVALCRLFIPWMAEQGGGSIINLSGGGATGPRPRFTAYATAKAALVRFSETLAAETKPLGIDVNCVAPGAMATHLLAEVAAIGPERAGQQEYDQARKVLQSSEDLTRRAVALCVFLASSASSGITGKLISAVWDSWEALPDHLDDLQKTDIFTLRRIVPQDRGRGWE